MDVAALPGPTARADSRVGAARARPRSASTASRRTASRAGTPRDRARPTRIPARVSLCAAVLPPGPPPTTIASKSWSWFMRVTVEAEAPYSKSARHGSAHGSPSVAMDAPPHAEAQHVRERLPGLDAAPPPRRVVARRCRARPAAARSRSRRLRPPPRASRTARSTRPSIDDLPALAAAPRAARRPRSARRRAARSAARRRGGRARTTRSPRSRGPPRSRASVSGSKLAARSWISRSVTAPASSSKPSRSSMELLPRAARLARVAAAQVEVARAAEQRRQRAQAQLATRRRSRGSGSRVLPSREPRAAPHALRVQPLGARRPRHRDARHAGIVEALGQHARRS